MARAARTAAVLALLTCAAAQVPADCIREDFESVGAVEGQVAGPIQLTPDVTLTLRAFNSISPFQEVQMIYCETGNPARCWVAPGSGLPGDTAMPTIFNTGEDTNQLSFSVSDNNQQGSARADYVLEFSQCISVRDLSILSYDFAADGGANGDLVYFTAYSDVARTTSIKRAQFAAFASIPDGAAIKLAIGFDNPTTVCAADVKFFKADGTTPSVDSGTAIDNLEINCLPGPLTDPCSVEVQCAPDTCFLLTNDLDQEAQFEYTLTKHLLSNNNQVGSAATGVVLIPQGGSQQFCFTYDPDTQYAAFSSFAQGHLGSCEAQLRAENCPACNLPASEWLETEFEPHLYIDGTGFVTGAPDVFRWSWDNHRKYMNTYFTVTDGNNDAGETEVRTEHHTFTGQPDEGCWDAWTLDVAWGDMVPYCHRDDTSDAQFVIYTCKLEIEGYESLDPIRSQALDRLVHNELVAQVLFPKQVTASVADLSAFRPPNVLAAIVRQEVNVDVSDLSVAAHVNLYTSVQYPFRLTDAAWDADAANPQPTGISGGGVSSVSDCTPYPDAGDSPGEPGDENACNQVWRFDLDVAGGADPGVSVCELDGDYFVQFRAVCLPTFPSDCPLVKDDQDQIDDIFRVQMTLDSEYFCPQVVDEVDVQAQLSVWKDLAHTVAATNFILGQTVYLVASVSSNKVTVAGAQLDDLEYDTGAGAVPVVVDKADNGGLDSFLWYDSGALAANGATVPDNEVWIQFKVTNPQFAPPVDGSSDFSVSVVLDVQFKDALAAVQLLAADRQLGAETSAQVSEGDETASPAEFVSATTALVASTAALALL